jgi:hypothetical protein
MTCHVRYKIITAVAQALYIQGEFTRFQIEIHQSQPLMSGEFPRIEPVNLNASRHPLLQILQLL